MTYPFPHDLSQRVQALLATGSYTSEDDVLRDAVRALEREKEEIAAIREGIDDMEAGRIRSLDEVDREIRKIHNVLF